MIKLRLKIVGDYKYDARSFAGYGYVTKHIHKMVDETGKVYVWNTESPITYKYRDPNGDEIDGRGNKWSRTFVNVGADVEISCAVKCESEYRGEHQTELKNVRVTEIFHNGPTEKEREAERQQKIANKRNEQLESLTDGDFVWAMPYKQYKEHYNDCETLAGSFEDRCGRKIITVIVRDGRLKPSGTRGRRFSGYKIRFIENGEEYSYVFWAVCVENAYKQLAKLFPGAKDPEWVETF